MNTMDDTPIPLHFFTEDLEPDRIRDDYDVSLSVFKSLRKESNASQSQSTGDANLLFTSPVPVPENHISMTKSGNTFNWNGVSRQGTTINTQTVTPPEPLKAFSSSFLGSQHDSRVTTNVKPMVISTPLIQSTLISANGQHDFSLQNYNQQVSTIFSQNNLLNVPSSSLKQMPDVTESACHKNISSSFPDSLDHINRKSPVDQSPRFEGFRNSCMALSSDKGSSKKRQLDELNYDVSPSDLLRQHMNNGEIRDADGFLPIHKACLHFPKNSKLIGMMIRSNANSIRSPVKKSGKAGDSFVSQSVINPQRKRSKTLSSAVYQNEDAVGGRFNFLRGAYPIHIAILKNASFEVIKLLVRSAPDTLLKGDGNGLVPISVALRCREVLVANGIFDNIVKLLIATNSAAIRISDNRMNSPLHYACMSYSSASNNTWSSKEPSKSSDQKIPIGAMKPAASVNRAMPFDILQLIIEENPSAVLQRNFNGQTPLNLAQSSGAFDDHTISFLHSKAYKEEDVEEI